MHNDIVFVPCIGALHVAVHLPHPLGFKPTGLILGRRDTYAELWHLLQPLRKRVLMIESCNGYDDIREVLEIESLG